MDAARFAPPSVRLSRVGSILELRSAIDLPARLPLPSDKLRFWAQTAPERVFVAERSGEAWRSLTFGEADRLSDAIAAALRGMALGADRPILIVGEPSCAQAALRFGTLKAGVPFLPVSPGLLRWGGEDRLRALLAKSSPGLLALSPACLRDLPSGLVAPELPVWSLDEDFLGGFAGAGPAASVATSAPPSADATAAVFFTSGSTAAPKGVVVTNRMIAANQEAYGALWPFLRRSPPVILDWLPWHHTFGGNDNLHKALWFGGSYFIDDGQPTADAFARSLENIRLVAPTIHLNVPRGLALLADRLEEDAALFDRFFERLDAIFFAGAGLSRDLWRRLRAMTARAGDRFGREPALVSGYGTTEAGSTICLVHFPTGEPRNVGLPIPGLALRLVPVDDKLEVRVKGPTVTPGYWRDPDLTSAAFDEDGFLRTGDAATFADPAAPERGLVFDGRIGEDFKLASGTWVSVGPLRLALLAELPPCVRDLLIAGHDRDRLGLVLFVDPGAQPADDTRSRIARALARHNIASPASSTVIRAAIIDPEPPSTGSGEVSDKGSLNQRLGLARRAALVERLFASPAHADIIIPDQGAR